MSNRVLIYMTIFVLGGMGILFYLNISKITGDYSNLSPQIYLKYNDVNGIAIKYQGQLYTLNFEQQNKMIDLLNRSLRFNDVKPEGQKPDIEAIFIYQFNTKKPMVLQPIVYNYNDNLIFLNPEWNPHGYLRDISHGEIRNLISQTYDH